MKIDLTDTTASKVNKALVQGRRAIGTPAANVFFDPQNTATMRSSMANPKSLASVDVHHRTSAKRPSTTIAA